MAVYNRLPDVLSVTTFKMKEIMTVRGLVICSKCDPLYVLVKVKVCYLSVIHSVKILSYNCRGINVLQQRAVTEIISPTFATIFL